MSTLQVIWEFMFSPKLYKIYGNGPVEAYYQPHPLEKWGNQVIRSIYIFWKIGLYTSPLLIGILYQKGYFASSDGLITLTKFTTSIGVILILSYFCRGFGRYQNSDYCKFMNTIHLARRYKVESIVKQELSVYDFDFRAWPVEFAVENKTDLSKLRLSAAANKSAQSIVTLPFRIIAYLAVNTFGIRLIYPGMTSLLQTILSTSLLQGRTRLVQSVGGERFKVKTFDNNEIDTMFIDKRNKNQNGNTLVICCEGNAGFYEIGIMITPIEGGYSVLGWNHPGFGGSTGQPFPIQEENAIDAVMQFAINKLGFKLENILLFGWSIGGYASSWAAMNYPDIKGIVIDATFDDIMPLAINHMPAWCMPIVRIAIRDYVNLDIYQQLAKYPGPVLLIRRTDDEVVCLYENDLSSNRGNNLLLKLLKNRYPLIMGEDQVNLLKECLSLTGRMQDQFIHKYAVNENMCNSLLQSYVSEYSKSFPMNIGEKFTNDEKNQMVLYVLKKYMKDFKATHCINLPTEMFQSPWDVNEESDFVFT